MSGVMSAAPAPDTDGADRAVIARLGHVTGTRAVTGRTGQVLITWPELARLLLTARLPAQAHLGAEDLAALLRVEGLLRGASGEE